jgi:hypothetical protein
VRHIQQTSRSGRVGTAIAGLQAAAVSLFLPVAPLARLAAAVALAGLVVLACIRYQGRRLPSWIAARIRFRRRASVRRGYRPRSAIETVVPGVDTPRARRPGR